MIRVLCNGSEVHLLVAYCYSFHDNLVVPLLNTLISKVDKYSYRAV